MNATSVSLFHQIWKINNVGENFSLEQRGGNKQGKPKTYRLLRDCSPVTDFLKSYEMRAWLEGFQNCLSVKRQVSRRKV